ncbi:trimethyllysine dioxygenase, mitochondrial-like [Glandiceps talaboti]
MLLLTRSLCGLRRLYSEKNKHVFHRLQLLHHSANSCTESTLKTSVPFCGRSSPVYSRRLHTMTGPSSPNAVKVVLKDNHIMIMKDKQIIPLSNPWLRDHCRCEVCYDKETEQRNCESLNVDMTPRKVNTKTSMKGKQLVIYWSDGHESTFNLDWLLDVFNPVMDQSQKSKAVKLWDLKTIRTMMPTAVSFREYLRDDDILRLVLKNLFTYGLAFVNDVPVTVEDSEKVVQRIGFLRETVWGKSFLITANFTYQDKAYTNEMQPAHTDGTYLNEPPASLAFHCFGHDGDGGNSLIVDGFNVAEKLQQSHPEYYQVLSEVSLRHDKILKDRKIHTTGTGPILQHCPVTNQLMYIRYGPFYRSLIDTNGVDLDLFYNALSKFSKELASPDNVLWTKLHPGTVCIMDNWRLLHGRSSFTGRRSLWGCFLQRDELNSKYRTMLDHTSDHQTSLRSEV